MISAMTLNEILNDEELRSLIDKYRSVCFWNFADDFMPKNERQLHVAIDNLERYGDMEAYRRAGRIKKWLSQISSPAY
jgi:hypothetical protein